MTSKEYYSWLRQPEPVNQYEGLQVLCIELIIIVVFVLVTWYAIKKDKEANK